MAKSGRRISTLPTTRITSLCFCAEISTDPDGTEVLPIRYDDNYVTVFPHDSRTIEAVLETSLLSGHKPVVRTEGYDVAKQIALLVSSTRK